MDGLVCLGLSVLEYGLPTDCLHTTLGTQCLSNGNIFYYIWLQWGITDWYVGNFLLGVSPVSTSPVRQLVSLPLIWPHLRPTQTSQYNYIKTISVSSYLYITVSPVKFTTCINVWVTLYLSIADCLKLNLDYMVINGMSLPSGLPTYSCSTSTFSYSSFCTVIIFPTYTAPIVFLPIVHPDLVMSGRYEQYHHS